MVQADSGPSGPPPTPSDGRRRFHPSQVLTWGLPVGLIVGALVTALIFIAVDRGGSAAGASPGSVQQPKADPSTAMCAAIPLAHQVLPSIVTIAAQRGSQAGTGSGQIIRTG